MLEQPLLEPVVKMAVAPNGRFLACFARDGKLAVMSSNFATKVSSLLAPAAWVTVYAVVLAESSPTVFVPEQTCCPYLPLPRSKPRR